MTGFIHALTWLRGLIRATLRPRPRISFWEWADKNVVVPEECGGPMPGQLRTSRFPIFRGLFDLTQQAHVHFVALCASVRVGKTLFSIVLMLYWIAERVGSVVWLDPSGQSAKKVSKSDIQPFIERCAAVWRLAILSKTTWQILWKTFRGKLLRLVGSGAEADLHGFNAELAILNELDRCKEAVVNRRGKTDDGREDASSADKIIARTILFPNTRLIVENASPGVAGEYSPIWVSFLRGSQHHCYLPCPHCSADSASRAKGPAHASPGQRPGTSLKDQPSPEGASHSAAWPVGWSEQSLDPHLAGWQRLTFSSEQKLVPFDAELRPLLDEKGRVVDREKWREETTGQIRFEQFARWVDRTDPGDATKKKRVKTGYDIAAVERGATYRCAHCQRDIEAVHLRWMLARYRWVSHNPACSPDRISAHVWRAYAPQELGGGFGVIAKEFIESKGSVAALIKFHNFTLGLPFIRTGTAVKEDDLDRVIARSPRYLKGEIPREAEMLTMTVDKQKEVFYYVIRARGVLWEHPDQPSWSALVDWGRAHSWDELLELAGLKPDAAGDLRRFIWTNPATAGTAGPGEVREYAVEAGLVDSGNEAELVYDFCLHRTTIFDPYKGCPPTMTRWSKIRMTKVHDEQLDLWLCWSDFFAAYLYYDCIKAGMVHGEPLHWWLPADIDKDYREQLTDEYQDGDGWLTRHRNNHLGDCEKEQGVLDDTVEVRLEALRDERRAKTDTPSPE